MIKILHVITGLGAGGAEAMLFKLLSGIDRSRFECAVVSLTGEGVFAARIADLGISVEALHLRGPVSGIAGVARLATRIREFRPDIVQTWLHHADLIGLLAARIADHRAVVWNLRCAALGAGDTSAANRALVRVLGALSRLPAAVIANSEAGVRAHRDKGYRPSRWEVLPNGFDTEKLGPNADSRARIRAEVGIPPTAPVIGFIGRYHPMKGHTVFLRAAHDIALAHPDLHLLLVGEGVDRTNPTLALAIDQLGLRERTHLLGLRHDIPAIMTALDLLISASTSEGFPNVVGEAMACGVPCVVTDAGDCRALVGEGGRVVAIGDVGELTRNAAELLALPPRELGEIGRLARKRIVETYDIGAICRRYEALYSEIVADSDGHG